MSDIRSVVDGHLLDCPDGATPVGSAAWYGRLSGDEAVSVCYRSAVGSYTARKENRNRGSAYWVAYRTAGGRQDQLYLGRPANLTATGRAEAARVPAERVAGVSGPPEPA